MATYLVFRHGSNSFNQPMTERTALGWFSAQNGQAACAAAEKVESVYANQTLSWKASSRCTADERRSGNAATALREDGIVL